MNPAQGILNTSGKYRDLLAYRKARIVFRLTHVFVRRFLHSKDRTVDQMLQAARSGKQNIIEGSKASRASRLTELNLVNVARSSLEELLEDYLDFLDTRGFAAWAKDSREAIFVRRLCRKDDENFETYRAFAEQKPPQVVANIAICLLHQANYLLDQLICRLEQDLMAQQSPRERLTAHRRQRLNKDKGRPT